MNRKPFFAALACAVLVFSMLGCGASNKLQSIQLSTSNKVETPGSTLNLMGIGGTLQLYVWGNYSNGKSVLLTSRQPVYQIVATPGSVAWTGVMGNPNATPAQTVQLDATGLLTAVTPFACTWDNVAAPPATTPAWAIDGSYTVTANYGGMTTPPVYVVVASAAGIVSSTNPNGLCGPGQ